MLEEILSKSPAHPEKIDFYTHWQLYTPSASLLPYFICIGFSRRFESGWDEKCSVSVDF